MISISSDNIGISDGISVVVVPEKAVTEPGYIKAFTSHPQSGSKHEFHALAQMAYFQFQDEELEIDGIEGKCIIKSDEGHQELMSCGLVIYRDSNSVLHVLAHRGAACKKLLEAAHRYCTRWVRLDI